MPSHIFMLADIRWDYISMTLLMLLGMFLMIVVLLQRGRGGGLAGAFGGAGGQSAFGTKAGDVFTKITVIIAVLWVVLAGASGFVLREGASKYDKAYGNEKDAEPEKGETKPSPFEKKDAEKEAPAVPPEGTDAKASGESDKQDEPSPDTKPAAGKDAGEEADTKSEEGPTIPKKPKGEESP